MTNRAQNISSVIIAVDGPSGAGKSTVSKLIAEKLGLIYIDTGAMYRAVSLKAKKEGADLKDPKALGAIATGAKIAFKKIENKNHVFLDGADVTDQIRDPDISSLTSRVSAVLEVRQALVEKQQEMGKRGGVILDGRDIGTVVFPDADYKFFLDAKLEVRGERRHLERGDSAKDLSLTIKEISKRDEADLNRKESPLCRADDAIYIDTTNLNIEDVAGIMERRIVPNFSLKG